MLLGLIFKIHSLEQGWQGRKFLKSCVFGGSRLERRPAIPSLPLGDREIHSATFLITCSPGIIKESTVSQLFFF